jgi:hypothetical protein
MDLVAAPGTHDVVADVRAIIGPRSPTTLSNRSDTVGEAGRAMEDHMVIRAT